jgi:hypothetical protein
VTGTPYTWELLIENHLDQKLWSTNQKYWVAVRSNLLHSLGLDVYAVPRKWSLQAKASCTNLVPEKPLSWAKLAHFDVFKINSTVWSHILSTGEDALRVPPNTRIKISEFFMSEATLLLGPHRSSFWVGSIDVCNFPYLGISPHVLRISPHVLRLCSDIPGRKNSGYIKTFLDANPHRKKSVHRDFSNATLEKRMWLKKQHYLI